VDLQALPRIELHRHLDCCLSFEAVRKIDPGVTSKRYERDFVAPARCASLAEYFVRTSRYRDTPQSARALRIAVPFTHASMSSAPLPAAAPRGPTPTRLGRAARPPA